jgi:hypothetical protein
VDAAGGRLAWKAVSKHATAGSCGSSSRTASSAASDFGWCSGASSARAQLRLNLGVDHDRLVEALSAVRDPVPDRVGVTRSSVERLAQRHTIDMRARRLQLTRRDRRVQAVAGEQRQLQAARASVDDEYAPSPTLPGSASAGDAQRIVYIVFTKSADSTH